MRVTVAIPTRKRPGMLAELLAALERQQGLGEVTMTVAVVDNDADGSALPVVAAARDRRLIDVAHHLEPVAGIAAARNRALQVATGDALAFIDDDEVPGSHWLSGLVHAMLTYNADAVFAPVLAVYGDDTPTWILRTAVFERRRLITGQAVGQDSMRTGNVLLSLAWLRRQGPALQFDNRLGLTGGEDTLFFSQAADRGLRAVWCDEAAVTEMVPAARASAGYLCRRHFQIGISSCAIAAIRDGQMGRLRELAKGLLLAPAGMTLGTLALAWSHPTAAKWYTKAMCGAGKVAGAMGHKFEIYKTTPTTQP